MAKTVKIVVIIILIILLLVTGLWFSIPQWLPSVARHWLPQGVTLSLTQPQWQNKGILVESIKLQNLNFPAQEQCDLTSITDFYIGYQSTDNNKPWLNGGARQIDSNYACLAKLTSSDTPTSEFDKQSVPFEIEPFLHSLPFMNFQVAEITVSPWQQYQGKLDFISDPKKGQQLIYQGENVSLNAQIENQRILLNKFDLNIADNQLSLQGQLQLSLNSETMPEDGEISLLLRSKEFAQPLNAQLSWQQKSGVLTLKMEDQQQTLVSLPWQILDDKIVVEKGQWQWLHDKQPLQGGINLTLTNWQQGIDSWVISSRLNVITQGSLGKGNVVLILPEAKIDLLDLNIPLLLVGQINHDNLLMTLKLPAMIKGDISDPTINFQSGSLARAKGRWDKNLTIEEIRLPLAGTTLSAAGISGPLNAIVKLKDNIWGPYQFQMQGKASHFLPDNGLWTWRVWGKGRVKPVNADWKFTGAGQWRDNLVEISTLETGFKAINYSMMSMQSPQLTLTEPIKWYRALDNQKTPTSIQGKLALSSKKITINESYLPSALFSMAISGTSLDDITLRGDLSAGDNIGPIPLYTRWDGSRLRGEARWPKQDLRAFQTLIPEDLGITLRSGDFYAQAAFSAAQKQGFVAGGHWVVKKGGMWLKDGEVDGVDFTLPWRLENSTWQLGAKSPVMLRIKLIKNLIDIDNLQADLQGFYPPTLQKPLTLSNVKLSLLSGTVSLDKLQLPQTEAAIINVKQLEMSELIRALKVSQFLLSGRIDGELPFYVDKADWIVKDGWVENTGPLISKLDQQFKESITENNLSAGAAIGWLDHLKISKMKADVNLTNLGLLTLHAQISGVNPSLSETRAVNLNYRHEENVFQLWRSLRFGSNLEEWLEKSISSGEQ